jgi:hypothetical protein
MTKAKPKPTDPNDPNLPIDRWSPYTRKIPYGVIKTGYVVDPNNPLLLVPDINQVFWIEKAFDYLEEGNSLRETADWVSQKIHRAVSHQTLSNLYKTYRKPYTFKKTNKRTGVKHTRDTKKVIAEKIKARAAVKRAEKVVAEVEAKKRQLKDEDWETPRVHEPPVQKAFEDTPDKFKISVAFEPSEKQKEFLRATEFEVLYGGAAGGGKSYAMIADPMRYFHNPNFNGLLLRRTNDELRELVRETQKLYPKVFVGAQWQEQKSRWKFPSGAELWMSYLDQDKDVMRYVGQSFTWVGIDELTQYPTPYAYDILRSRIRTSDPELKKVLSMRATTNPGGPGHGWVKKRFVDPAVPNTPFWATDDNGEIMRYPDDEEDENLRGKPLHKRIFIPAFLADNPHLSAGGEYRRNLLSLPEDQRRKLLEGDWSIVEGAAFSEWNPKYHVVKSEDLPPDWLRFRAADFGYSSHSAVLWFAIEPGTGILHVYRELYVSRKTGVDLADLILSMESHERVQYGVLDSSVWHQRGHNGPSIAEEMIARGCRWRMADRTAGSRIAGKNRLHELLKIDPYLDQPGIVFHDKCRQIIADLPMIPKDPDGGEDIDDKYVSDHTYDALRYGIMSRPKTNIWGEWADDRKQAPKWRPADPTFGY